MGGGGGPEGAWGRGRNGEGDGDDGETGDRAEAIRGVLRGSVRRLGGPEDSSVVESAFVAKRARSKTTDTPPRRLVVAITGSTGAIYGVRLLEQLRKHAGFELHLILSNPAKRTLAEETELSVKDVEGLAHVVHDNRDIGASVASGSFRTEGMVVAPCSMKTASALATSHGDTLIARAGDVTLKEGRRLIVVVRETPLHSGTCASSSPSPRSAASSCAHAGLLPPAGTVDDIVNHTVARILERLGIDQDLVPEWTGHRR